jgi:hypothetical protein
VSRLFFLLAIFQVTGLIACTSHSPSELFPGGCNIETGELLITELMPYPGPGEGEWLELHNPTERTISLEKAVIQVITESATRFIEMPETAEIAAGDWWVIGTEENADQVLEEALALNNTAAEVALICKQTVIDNMRYGETAQTIPQRGISINKGVLAMGKQSTAIETWCNSYMSSEGNVGATPGEINLPCGDICFDGETYRAIRVPEPGDVQLTEVLANPIGSDSGNEWLELVNASDQPLDLNSLRVVFYNPQNGNERDWNFAAQRCQVVASQQRVLVANSAQNAEADYYAQGEDIYNGEVEIRIESPTAILLVEDFAASDEGVSWQLDSVFSSTYCASRLPAESGMLTSGNAENHPCGDYCLAQGEWRELIPPAKQDIKITEVYNNPLGVDDNRDWVEIYHGGGEQVYDLNGLQFRQSRLGPGNAKPRVNVISSVQCQTIAPGEYKLMAWENAELRDDLSPVPMEGEDIYSKFALQLDFLWHDEVITQASIGPSCSGRSLFLDPLEADPMIQDNWCYSTSAYNDYFATPGTSNESCDRRSCSGSE